MRILKCDCSRSIHIFLSAENMVCPFCGKQIAVSKAIDNSFLAPYLFLNEKLAEIDRQIGAGKFVSVKTLINEVLEVAPGTKIGDMPNSGEVHWRKLLTDVGCKNDAELLIKGKPLQEYAAFTNALKYASENEKPIYASIDEKKGQILAALKKVLVEQEHEEKRGTGAEKSLVDYQKELDALQKQVQENVTLLESVEKLIHERVIDYMAAVGEYKYTLTAIHSNAQNIGSKNDTISMEQRDSWIRDLDVQLSHANREVDEFKKLESTNEHYLEYSKLTYKQKNIVSNIKGNISQINSIKSKVEDLLAKIAVITRKYSEARSSLKDGNYNPARALIPQSKFDEMVKQIMAVNQS